MKYIFASLIIVLTACQSNKTEKKVEQETEEKNKHWSYAGETSPEYWEKIERHSECGGQFQSPVNIIDVETVEGELTKDIVRSEYQVISHLESLTNNGHTIQYNFEADSNFLVYHRSKFKLMQFHFHSPSEHTVNGVRYPLEIHAVHFNENDSAYIVFSMLVQQGNPDPAFTFLEKYLPLKAGETKMIDAHYNFDEAYPELVNEESAEIYTYRGSLTTPPCAERVLWMILKEPIRASAEQIELLQVLMPDNNYRETQPLNGRQIYVETITDEDF